MSGKLSLLLTILLSIYSLHTTAQSVCGLVCSEKNDMPLQGATIELLSAKDSSIIKTVVTEKTTLIPNVGNSNYLFTIQPDTAYILRFSMIGYQTQYKTMYPVAANTVKNIEKVYLKEDIKSLQEVVVKATRIKMRIKGDTIVYDANAFNLSEYSMLESLIKQLPGAQLKNGVITINGRKVSSLFIDGRNLFQGNIVTALHNLPAYTVDKVKVYEHDGESSRLMGRDMGDKELVVDVNMKKQYKMGWMANTNVGYGTQDRYNANLYSMLYGKKDNLTIHANTNNVGNSTMHNDKITEIEMMPLNMVPTTAGKLSVSYSQKGKTFDDNLTIRGNLDTEKRNKEQRNNSQIFLTGGDHYELVNNLSDSKSKQQSASLLWGKRLEKRIINLKIFAEHGTNDEQGQQLSGRWKQYIKSMADAMDSLFLPNRNRFSTDAIHATRTATFTDGNNTHYRITVTNRMALGKEAKKSRNELFVDANLSYQRAQRNNFMKYDIRYFEPQTTAELRQQYTDNPSKAYLYEIGANYTRLLTKPADRLHTLLLTASYKYMQNYKSAENNLYRIDRLPDYNQNQYALAMLPSTREALLQVMDKTNSFESRKMDRANDTWLKLNYIHKVPQQGTTYKAKADIHTKLLNEELNYFREKSFSRKRQKLLFNPTIMLEYQKTDSTGNKNIELHYQPSQQPPALLSMLNIHDDTDPLHIKKGNENLKDARYHTLTLSYNTMRMSTYMPNWNTSITYTNHQNAIATATLYNKEKGISTTQLTNVSGNWSLALTGSYRQSIDKEQKHSINLTLAGQYASNIDLTTVENAANVKSRVNTTMLNAMCNLYFVPNKNLMLTLNANTTHQRTSSDRPLFVKSNVWNHMASMVLNWKLPHGIELSTSIIDNKLSGYNDPQMNENHLTWNARVLKKMIKGKLTIALEAFDILKDMSNTEIQLNEQGRIETWTNSIPHYAMLHIGYKFLHGRKR